LACDLNLHVDRRMFRSAVVRVATSQAQRHDRAGAFRVTALDALFEVTD
jgi:hypothetical protein